MIENERSENDLENLQKLTALFLLGTILSAAFYWW